MEGTGLTDERLDWLVQKLIVHLDVTREACLTGLDADKRLALPLALFAER